MPSGARKKKHINEWLSFQNKSWVIFHVHRDSSMH